MAPASLIAETHHFKSSNGKHFSVRRPFDTGDNMIVGKTAVKLAAVLVPHAVLAILTTGNNQVASRVPVSLEHDTIVGLPLNLLVAGKSGHNDKILVRAVKD
jgi:hypothetical protein